MADVAETKETTPVVEKEVAEKEVEDVEAPKVAEVEEKSDENGKSEEPAAAAENGTSDKEEDAKDDDEDAAEKENNGDSTDAPAEAVKRKGDEPVEGTPEKKSKLAESEVETNGTTETEAAA